MSFMKKFGNSKIKIVFFSLQFVRMSLKYLLKWNWSKSISLLAKSWFPLVPVAAGEMIRLVGVGDSFQEIRKKYTKSISLAINVESVFVCVCVCVGWSIENMVFKQEQ